VDFLIVLVVLAAVVLLVSAPLLRRRDALADAGPPEAPGRATLEAAREAKYREIREAELDHRTGKLSDADYEAIDHALRAEAMEILRSLDEFEDPRPSTPETRGASDGEGGGD
jgi:hypothetical protein